MIPYVREIKFEYGKVDQVSPLIRRVIANNPGPFTFVGTGTYIIGKGEGLAVIDPGPDLPEHLQAILDELWEANKPAHVDDVPRASVKASIERVLQEIRIGEGYDSRKPDPLLKKATDALYAALLVL